MKEEIWKPVVGFEGLYEVSDLGRVRSLDRYVTFQNRWGSLTTRRFAGQLVQPGPHQGGYLQAHFAIAGKDVSRTLHSVVAEAFIGPRPPGYEVLHKDGDQTNNCSDNLRYGTRLENEADKEVHGTRQRGEKHKSSKLTEADVLQIRARVGERLEDLAAEFGCTFSNISAIQLRKSWRHV